MVEKGDEATRSFAPFDPGQRLAEEHSPFVLDPEVDAIPAPRQTIMWWHLVLIFIGGAIGTGLRYEVIRAAAVPDTSLPWEIMVINISGAFAMGLLSGAVFLRRPDLVSVRLFLAPGLLGGWTTYSSIIAGTLTLAHDPRVGESVVALLVAFLLPPAAALAGMTLTGWQWKRRGLPS